MNFKHLALASAVVLTSSGALANDVVEDITALGGTTFFGALHTDSSDFTDVFTFTVAGLANASAALVTVGAGANNIDFLTVDLNGFALTLSSTGAGFAEAAVTDATLLGLTGPLVLTVTGKSGAGSGVNATYAGTMNVTQVPEPETYALMLAGLGAMGFLARQRKA